VQFIEHFVSVYDSKAPRFTELDAEWSASDAATSSYETEQQHYMREIAHLV
jgi:hypothetical protein